MPFVIGIAVLVFSLLASLGAAVGVRRARRQAARRLRLVLEQRSLAELTEIRSEIETSYPIPRSSTLRWYKRVRLVLSVYAHERFGVSVRERISGVMFEHLVQRHPDSWSEIRHLRTVFDELTDAEEQGHHLGDLGRVVSSAVTLLGRRITTRDPAAARGQAAKRTRPHAVVRRPE